MLPVSRLVFAESDAEADEFYSAACTALAHGGGHLPRAAAQRQTRLHGRLLRAERPARAYMAAGVTDAANGGAGGWRGWLIAGLANELTAAERDGAGSPACPALRGFYAAAWVCTKSA